MEKHLRNPENVFYKMKEAFILVFSKSKASTDDLISDLNQFIRLMWETSVDYYKVDDLDNLSGVSSFFT